MEKLVRLLVGLALVAVGVVFVVVGVVSAASVHLALSLDGVGDVVSAGWPVLVGTLVALVGDKVRG